MDQTTLEALRESAHTYRRELVNIPMQGLRDTVPFVTPRLGVRYAETVCAPDFDTELMHYSLAERKELDGSYNPRTLKTSFGAAFFDFDPNEMISTIYGHRAAQAGQGAKDTVTAKDIVATALKGVGAKLNRSLFKAKLNEKGKTTADLFDGWDSITEAEIKAGNISEAKGNLYVLPEKLTRNNATKLLKGAIRHMAPELRDEDCFMYLDRAILDDYNEDYLMTHQSVTYNKQYNQPELEGSGGKIVFAPLAGKSGSKYIQVTTKANMLLGLDQLSDTERVEINKYEPKKLTGEIYMFAGTQFASVDPRILFVIKLADEAASGGSTGTETGKTETPDPSKS